LHFCYRYLLFCPDHPCLTLVSNSEQPLSIKWKRRLITMKKTIEFDINLHQKALVEYATEDVAHANFAMKRFNDPNRHDKRHQQNDSKSGSAEYEEKEPKRQKVKK